MKYRGTNTSSDSIRTLRPRDIRQIAATDHDNPRMASYILLTLFFVILNAAYYFFWIDLARPFWEPLLDIARAVIGLLK